MKRPMSSLPDSPSSILFIVLFFVFILFLFGRQTTGVGAYAEHGDIRLSN